MADAVTRTTLTIPTDLLEQVDRAVREGRAHNRNSFVVMALRRELAAAEAAAIDAAFAAMGQDEAYTAEAHALSEEFAVSDWEALRVAETTP